MSVQCGKKLAALNKHMQLKNSTYEQEKQKYRWFVTLFVLTYLSLSTDHINTCAATCESL